MIPPDPEGMNDARASWAAAAIEEFMNVTGTDPGDAIYDLLCDLMHLCDRDERFGSFESGLLKARLGYADETKRIPNEGANWQ